MLPKACALFVILILATDLPFGNSYFSSSTGQLTQQQFESEHTRVKRGFNLWEFFETIFNMGRIVKEQYNDTVVTLNQVYDIVADGFTDVSTKNPPPAMNTTVSPDGSTTTTTERYRISRYEFGRILGRNYRGLKRLLDIEYNDALNQSKYNIRDYQDEVKNAIANYAEFEKDSRT